MHSFYRFFPIVLLAMGACAPQQTEVENPKPTAAGYPESLEKIFQAHGGIEAWQDQKILNFVIDGSEQDAEVHTVDLQTRQSRLETPRYIIGNDGKNIWLVQDSAYFTKSPRFYHNLMFYFYAMPFVLGDAGIRYQEVAPTQLLDKSYPGIRISYEANIGDAPDDEYLLYYDPQTYRMEWLAYTVTYFSQEKSKEFKIIHYPQWEDVDGFLLPAQMDWYSFENGVVGTPKYSKTFSNAKVSKVDVTGDLWTPPPGSVIDTSWQE